MTADVSKPPLMGTAREWGLDLAVSLAIGVLLGLMGPFGSYLNGEPWQRIAYWTGSILCGMVVFGGLIRLLSRQLRLVRAPGWVVVPVATLLGSIVQGALTRRAAIVLWPDLERLVSDLHWYAQCVAISAPIVVVYYLLRIRGAERARAASPPFPTGVPVAEPLAAGEVLCLRMEDHYVRIHTAIGSRLVAGPFERVIAGLGDREGMRVHRSWWVARSAVIGVEVDGRNLRLKLSNGLQAPVARASVARLRQLGWLE